MSEVRYFRARDLGREVIFDIPGVARTAPREELERYFVGCLEKYQTKSTKTGTDEIVVKFLRDSLLKIRAGHTLTDVTYKKS